MKELETILKAQPGTRSDIIRETLESTQNPWTVVEALWKHLEVLTPPMQLAGQSVHIWLEQHARLMTNMSRQIIISFNDRRPWATLPTPDPEWVSNNLNLAWELGKHDRNSANESQFMNQQALYCLLIENPRPSDIHPVSLQYLAREDGPEHMRIGILRAISMTVWMQGENEAGSYTLERLSRPIGRMQSHRLWPSLKWFQPLIPKLAPNMMPMKTSYMGETNPHHYARAIDEAARTTIQMVRRNPDYHLEQWEEPRPDHPNIQYARTHAWYKAVADIMNDTYPTIHQHDLINILQIAQAESDQED